MKKTLVAIAALAATGAFAQSSVTIDGGLDAGYQAIDYKGNKVNGINGNGSSTSQINFRGVSDLGGGLKADFRVETDWNTTMNRGNTGAASVTNATQSNEKNSAVSSFGNGEIRVGVNGGFGRVDMGAVNLNGLTTILTGQPFGTAIGGGYGSLMGVNQGFDAVRADQAVKYTSPAISGLTATLYKSNKQTKGSNTANDFSTTLGRTDMAGTQEIGLNYANGPIAASYSTLTQNNVDVTTGASTQPAYDQEKSKVNTLGASYTMGAAKLMYLNQTNKTTTSADVNKSYQAVSATYTMGQTVLMASTGTAKDKLDGDKSKLTALGADYNLSKTTALYARYEKIKDDAGLVAITGFTAATGNVTRTRTAFGLRTSF
jgi:predicted porin